MFRWRKSLRKRHHSSIAHWDYYLRQEYVYGFWNNRILLCLPGLEVNLLRSVPRKISLSRCDTSFECLACQLMAQPMYSVIISEFWKIRRYLNLCLPWVIGRRVGEVFYPLERTRFAGSNTWLWRRNRWLGLNHSISRTHELRGPFKYGRYGTETASVVVIGDAESVGTQVNHLLLVYTLFNYFIVYLVPQR